MINWFNLNKHTKQGTLIIAMTVKLGKLAAVEMKLFLNMAETPSVSSMVTCWSASSSRRFINVHLCNILSSHLDVIIVNMIGIMLWAKIDDHYVAVKRQEKTIIIQNEDYRDIYEILKDATEDIYETNEEEFISEE